MWLLYVRKRISNFASVDCHLNLGTDNSVIGKLKNVWDSLGMLSTFSSVKYTNQVFLMKS